MNEATQTMNVEKKTIRTDIPGHQAYLNGSATYTAPAAEGMRRMIVGHGITLAGNIADCDHLVVEGAARAESFAARRLDIATGGLFTGHAEVQDAVIAGNFEGRLVVTGRLVVKSTGVLSGEISYGALEVENGGRIEGNMSMLAVAVETVAETPAEKPKMIKTEKTTKEQSGNVERLFGETTTMPESRGRVYRRAG